MSSSKTQYLVQFGSGLLHSDVKNSRSLEDTSLYKRINNLAQKYKRASFEGAIFFSNAQRVTFVITFSNRDMLTMFLFEVLPWVSSEVNITKI